MIRKLAFALSFLSAGFTGLVYALGLGEATVQSALNQPLKAEIELVNVGELEAAEVLPGLATREEFLKAGVDRVYFLSDIRFTVKEAANGKLAVELTTSKPVREPYLNFLVEVIWPSGRLLREYALLIDPPLFAEDEPAVVAAPAVAASVAQQPQSVRPAGDRIAVPVQAVTATPTTIDGATYGPTSSRDTLWEIAMKARPDRSVSPQQVMLAIQDLNPNAFIDGNINKLKAGQVLRLPSKADMQTRSTYEAINEVIAQNEALQPRKRSVAASTTAPAPAAPRSNQASVAAGSGDELKLVVADSTVRGSSDGAETGATGGAGRGDADKDLTLTLEKLDKAEIENEELNGRVEDLEEQLATLQRLLTLKNDQLSSIQQQMRENEMARMEAAAGDEVADSSADTALDEESLAEAREPGTEAEVDAATATERAMAEEAEQDAAVFAEAASERESAEAQEAVAAPAPAKAEKPVGPVKNQPKPVTETKGGAQQNLIEMILGNPLYLALAVLSIVVLLVILWLVSRHNARQEEALHQQMAEMEDDTPLDDEPAFAATEEHEETEEAPAAEELPADTFEEEALYPEEELATTSQVGDEADDSALGGEQEDIIAEADVYIAYGRLDQASAILEEAISREPVRTDYRLKLLEVYKEAGNVDAFERQFNELEAIQDESALAEANRIRAELAPAEPETFEEELGDFEASLSEEQLDSLDEELAPATEENDADLDLSADDNFSLDTVEGVDEADEIELDVDLSSEELDLDVDVELDLDSDKLDLGGDLPADSASEEIDDSMLDAAMEQMDQELSEDVDLELDDIELSEELEQESEIQIPDDLSIPDELTGLDDEAPAPLEDPGEIARAAEAAKVEVPESPDTVVSDDILDEAVEALGDPDSFEPELGDGDDFDFLDGTDETSTKLDLARAYIDMGDIDGARDILQEVESEGSPEQQAEAKSLRESLGD